MPNYEEKLREMLEESGLTAPQQEEILAWLENQNQNKNNEPLSQAALILALEEKLKNNPYWQERAKIAAKLINLKHFEE